MLKITSLCAMFLFFTVGMFAQMQTDQEVSKEELKKFASAYLEIQAVNQNVQTEMITAIEEEGLTLERYNEMSQSIQNPNEDVNASEAEIETYQEVVGNLQEIQMKAQSKMQKEIEKAGLTMERYQEIAAAIQSSPELQQEIQPYLQG